MVGRDRWPIVGFGFGRDSRCINRLMMVDAIGCGFPGIVLFISFAVPYTRLNSKKLKRPHQQTPQPQQQTTTKREPKVRSVESMQKAGKGTQRRLCSDGSWTEDKTLANQ